MERLVDVYPEGSHERRSLEEALSRGGLIVLVDGPEALEEALSRGGLIVLVDGPEEAARLVDELAPEHVELMVEDYLGMLGRVRRAGAVFLGGWSPVAIGDYVAGPSHVLPSGGYARYYSGLSARSFVRGA